MSDIITRAILKDEMSAQLAKIKNEFSQVNAQAKKTSKGTDKASKSFGGMTGKATLMKTALTGLAVGGIGIFAKAIVGAAAEMETLETKFKVLLGDTDSAKARMQELSKFASTTPFQLTEIANASRVLQTLGGTTLATGQSLRLVGDAAAISGESFENLAVHVGRAYSGLQANRPIGESLARLQELGLVSGETRNQIEDLTKAAKGKDAWKVLQKELQKSSGGMDTLSKTFGGLSSTLKDQFQEVLRQVANSGFFEDIKKGLAVVVGKMTDWINSGIFLRIGAGWDYMKFGFMGMSQVVLLGFQRIGEASIKMLKEMVGAVNGFLNFLPDSIVPDSWIDGMSHAEKTLDLLYKDMQDGADDMQINALDNLSKMQTAWGKMTGAVSVKGKKYVETNKEATNSDKNRVDNNAKSNEKQLSDDAAFYEKLSQNMRDTEQDVTLALLSEADRRREELRIKQEERIALIGETDNVILLHKKETADLEVDIEKNKQTELKKQFDKEKNIQLAKLSLAQSVTSSLATITRNALGSSKKNANARKTIALSEAIINTSLGVTKALSSSAPPMNLINAGIVGSQGAASISSIASQKFASGGIVRGGSSSDIGDKTMIRVNAGEGVFTKDQMKALGGMNNAPSVSIGDINISGDADSSTIEGLDNTLQKFANKILDSIRGGELDLVNELNLVTQ